MFISNIYVIFSDNIQLANIHEPPGSWS